MYYCIALGRLFLSIYEKKRLLLVFRCRSYICYFSKYLYILYTRTYSNIIRHVYLWFDIRPWYSYYIRYVYHFTTGTSITNYIHAGAKSSGKHGWRPKILSRGGIVISQWAYHHRRARVTVQRKLPVLGWTYIHTLYYYTF